MTDCLVSKSDYLFDLLLCSTGSEGCGDGAFGQEVSRLYQKNVIIQAFNQRQVA